MFGWEFPPLHSGGLGVACQGMVNGLLKHGTRVTLVLPSAMAEGEASLDIRTASQAASGSTIRYVKSNLKPYEGMTEYEMRVRGQQSENKGTPIDLYGSNMGEAIEQFTAQSVDATRDVNPDVIHCHDWMTYDAGIMAADHHRVPVVMHIHATELDRTDFRPDPWIEGKERWALRKASRVIAVSNYTKNLLVQHYGINSDKISVVHNGHDIPHNAKPVMAQRKSKTPFVLFLGRLTTQKNPWQFLEAARLVHAARPETRFIMAGEGPMQEGLIKRACDLGLTGSVLFTGKVSRSEADDLYRKASCFVMPSLSEPFGLVALEAIGHGTPLVMSRQSGAAEVIEHCFKVDFWDTERFADCILTILREQPLADQLRAEAPRILQKLSWSNQSAQILSIYHSLIRA
jgi:glycogen synthase